MCRWCEMYGGTNEFCLDDPDTAELFGEAVERDYSEFEDDEEEMDFFAEQQQRSNHD